MEKATVVDSFCGRQLPPEVLGAIVGLISDKAALLRIALVSSEFYDFAMRALLRRVQLILPTNTIKFRRLLARKPYLAAYIRSLELAVMPRAIERNEGKLNFREYKTSEAAVTRLVGSFLPLLTGLKRLIWVAPHPGVLKILLRCPFQLEILHLNTVDQFPIAFLKTQKGLKEIIFWSQKDPTEATISAIKENKNTMLTETEHIGARYQVLNALLPGRQLKSCDYLTGPTFSKEDLSALLLKTGETSSNMVYVHLCLKTLAQLDLSALSAAFPRVRTMYIHIYGGEPPDCFFLDWFQQSGTLEAFKQFEALESIKLSHAQFQNFSDPDRFQAALNDLAVACPTLKSLEAVAAHIDYISSSRTLIKDSYYRMPERRVRRRKNKNSDIMQGTNPDEVWLISKRIVKVPISAAWSAAYPLELSGQ